MSDQKETPSKKRPLEEKEEPEAPVKRAREESARPTSQVAEAKEEKTPLAGDIVPFVLPAIKALAKPFVSETECKIRVWTADEKAGWSSPEVERLVRECMNAPPELAKVVCTYLGGVFPVDLRMGPMMRVYADNETLFPQGILRVDWRHDVKESFFAWYSYGERVPVMRKTTGVKPHEGTIMPRFLTDFRTAVFEIVKISAPIEEPAWQYVVLDEKGQELLRLPSKTEAIGVSWRYLYFHPTPSSPETMLVDCVPPFTVHRFQLPSPYTINQYCVACVGTKLVSRSTDGLFFWVDLSAPAVVHPCTGWTSTPYRGRYANHIYHVQPEVLVLLTGLELVIIDGKSMEPRIRVQLPSGSPIGLRAEIDPAAMWRCPGYSAFACFLGFPAKAAVEEMYTIDTATGHTLARVETKTATTVTAAQARGRFLILREPVEAQSGHMQPSDSSLNEYVSWYSPRAEWRS